MEKFISCDWGTSNFRLRLVEAANYEVLATLETQDGIAVTHNTWQQSGIAREKFYGELLMRRVNDLAASVNFNLQTVPVIISGMASSSLGMIDLPYSQLPLDHTGTSLGAVKTNFLENVFVIPGVRSANDVMRGEETQWIGVMQQQHLASLQALLCIFPGTHCKHILAAHGIMKDFHTYMTGEFYEILKTCSVLKNSVGEARAVKTESQRRAFNEGVLAASGASLLHQAFMVRTNQLLGQMNKEDNAFFLSGLLIGSELQNVNSPEVVIAAKKDLAHLYQMAFETLSYSGQLYIITDDDYDKAIIKGQFVIFNSNRRNNE